LETHGTEVRAPTQYGEFYHHFYRSVVALAYGLSGSSWTAEDLAQEAFLRAYRDWASVSQMAAPGAWVKKVTVNLALSRFRRLRAEGMAVIRLSAAARPVVPISSAHDSFWIEVRRLPKRQAQAIALRYIDDLSIADIAVTLGVAQGTVKALLHQGRAGISRKLGAKGWFDDEI